MLEKQGKIKTSDLCDLSEEIIKGKRVKGLKRNNVPLSIIFINIYFILSIPL